MLVGEKKHHSHVPIRTQVHFSQEECSKHSATVLTYSAKEQVLKDYLF